MRWSDNDRAQLSFECAAKDIVLPENMNCWFDLQREFPHLAEVETKRYLALDDAVCMASIGPQYAIQHRTLDDAEVTAELLCLALNDELASRVQAVAERRAKKKQRKELRKRGYQYPPLEEKLMHDALAGLYEQMVCAQASARSLMR